MADGSPQGKSTKHEGAKTELCSDSEWPTIVLHEVHLQQGELSPPHTLTQAGVLRRTSTLGAASYGCILCSPSETVPSKRGPRPLGSTYNHDRPARRASSELEEDAFVSKDDIHNRSSSRPRDTHLLCVAFLVHQSSRLTLSRLRPSETGR